MKTLIKLLLKEQSDLGLYCLPRPVCPKTLDHYGDIILNLLCVFFSVAPVHDVLSTDQYESTTTLESSSYYSTTDLTTLEVDNGTPEVNNGTPEVNNGTPKPTFNVLMICQLCVCILVCLYFITQ